MKFILKILTFMILTALFTNSVSSAQEICPLNGMPLQARGIKSLKYFQETAVLENGRVKPLDTYAQNLLLRLSGKKTLNKRPAIEWLAKFLFTPQATVKDRVFLINNPGIATALNIKEQKDRRYSYEEVLPAFATLSELAQKAQTIEPKQRDLVENEIIRIFDNFALYSKLMLTFSFAMPHPDFTVQHAENLYPLKFNPKIIQYSFIDLALKADVLAAMSKPLELKDADEWTLADKELMTLINNLYIWNMSYTDLPFQIIAPLKESDENWSSPWDAMSPALSSKTGREDLANLARMMAAYWNGQQAQFDIACKNFNRSMALRTPKTGTIKLEVFLNKLNLLFWSKFVYLCVFFIFLISLIKNSRPVYVLSSALLGTAFLMHAASIVGRIIILARPPVSNLYETFIFVGLVCVLAGLLIERIQKGWVGVVIASLSGFVFLTIASKFSIEGDTLQMLVAVLNSNFWLSTHVLSITIGYAGACVAGIIGHIYLLQIIFKTRDKKLHEGTYNILVGTLGFGLTMTFLGTNLGGIWADQSWGRFWGWDPKENGALLIVLWIAILFHCKIAKIISPVGMAAASGLGLLVVMWAWFGVNLLSIGLHSYGFTSGLAMNLTIYAVVQIFLLAFLMISAQQKLKLIKK